VQKYTLVLLLRVVVVVVVVVVCCVVIFVYLFYDNFYHMAGRVVLIFFNFHSAYYTAKYWEKTEVFQDIALRWGWYGELEEMPAMVYSREGADEPEIISPFDKRYVGVPTCE
jgi:hypothetical protein